MLKRVLQRRESGVEGSFFKEGFFAGVGWAFGVTVGFVLISTIIVFILQQLGGLPLIGGWIATLVEETQVQLVKRTPVF